jgi:hypothetical protein
MEDNFSGNINQPSTHRAGIGANRYNWGTDIFFERLEQEMADQHHIIPGRVGREPLEGQLLMAKILNGPVGQFVTAAFVITGDKSVGRQISKRSSVFKKPVNRLTLPDVGNDYRVRSATRQIKLVAVIMHQTTIDGPSKALPVPLPAAELGILPGLLFRGFKSFPPVFIPVGSYLFDVFVHLATTHIADMKGFTQIKNLLVEKTAVHANDYRYIPAVVAFDFDYHMPNHIQHAVTVIGMLVPATEYRIDNVTAPVHLQGLGSLFLFVGRFDALSAQRIVVIHHHRIYSQLDDLGLGDPQAPEKKGLQQTPEQKYPRPGKGFEEPFDLMRRGHVCVLGLDAAGIAFILRKLVEIGQPTAGAIYKEAQHLLEKLGYSQALPVFTDGAETAIKPIENLNAVQIRHKQSQTSSASQPVGSGFDSSNFQFILPVISAMFAHRVLYLLGGVILVVTLAGFNKYYNTLPDFRGLFLFKYRSL